MKMLGIQNLFVSNAAGSLNPDFKKGSLMIIKDHINLLPENPLRGINSVDFGPRFPDMSEAYSKKIRKNALEIADKLGIECHEGVYVSVSGPNLETKAEYNYLRIIGGDAVGMSTVPEVIVARHMDIPVFAISVLTDEGFPDELLPVSLEEIIETAALAEPKMTKILAELISVI
jgi:purine-nucleoside phosphorylase